MTIELPTTDRMLACCAGIASDGHPLTNGKVREDLPEEATPDLPPVARPLAELVRHRFNDPNELLQHRFLCRLGTLLVCGPTGIGKSSLAMQMMVSWSLAREAFGIKPAGPLKSLLIQAENDDGDQAEMRDGVFAGLELTDAERDHAGTNIIVAREDVRSGMDFLSQTVRPLLAEHRPDLVWLDPMLSFLGGETNSQKDVGGFLRNGLNPLLREFNCGCVEIHHTNKPPSGTEKPKWAAGDFAYLGSGNRRGKTKTNMDIRQAIDDLITSKTSGNKRPAYVTNLRQVLDAWSRGQDHRSLASITLDEIESHVASRAAVGTRLSAINRLSTLFSFAVRKGWLAVNSCERIERPTIEAKLPAILSNADAAKMLACIRVKLPRFVPWFALSLFGGLRPKEADQISWDAMNLDNGSVLIDPGITKVRNARTVHLERVAVAWLKLGGDLPTPKASRRRAARTVRDFMGWQDWPKDVLRHTAASHWIALKKSYGAVALEMGNSEQILRKHYRAEVPDDVCQVS